MHTIAFATFVCLAWLLQLFLVWLQTKQHKRLMRSLIQTYRSHPDLYLTSGMNQKIMRPAASVFLIVDAKYVIRDCRVKSGYSVFARYHRDASWIEQDVRKILTQLAVPKDKRAAKREKPLTLAMRQACTNARDVVRKAKQQNRQPAERRASREQRKGTGSSIGARV